MTVLDTGLGQPPTILPVATTATTGSPVIVETRPRDPRLVVNPNDLLPVSFLVRGAAVARAVGRIVRPENDANHEAVGTGFMISENLLLTNWHILRSAMGAKGMAIQFGYEQDGPNLDQGRLYDLAPEVLFLTNRGLDYAVVAVAPAEKGKPVGAVEGVIPLTQDFRGAREGDWVNIIQHAGGLPKSVVIRENQVVSRPGDLLLYTADTTKGSSGAPVLNDRWELVALHRRGIGAAADGLIANTGVRASSVARALRARAQDPELPSDQAQLLRTALTMPEPAPAHPQLESAAAGKPDGQESRDPEIAALRDWLDQLSSIVWQQQSRPHMLGWEVIEDPAAIYAAMDDYGLPDTRYGKDLLLDLYADVPDDEHDGDWLHDLWHRCGGKH